jgi:WD40 repeat protein
MSREDSDRVIRSWPLPEGEPEVLGKLEDGPWDVDPTGTWLAFRRGRSVHVRPLGVSGPAFERVLGSSRDEVQKLMFAPTGDRLASIDSSDEIRLWPLDASARAPLRILDGPEGSHYGAPFLFGGDGSALTTGTGDGALHVWDLGGPPDAQPAVLRRPDEVSLFPAASDPSGRWLAASDGRAVAFWPLSSPRMRALDGRPPGFWLPFTADGRWLVSCGFGATRRWPLRPADGSVRDLTEGCRSAATHPAGPQVLVGTWRVLLVPIEGGPLRPLLDAWEGVNQVSPVAFDVQGRRAVAGAINFGGHEDPKQRVLRIWDLESGEERVISVADITDASWVGFSNVAFAPDGGLLVSGSGGVRRLVLPDEPGGAVSSETVYAQTWAAFDLSRDGRSLLVWALHEGDFGDVGCDELFLFDLREHTSRRITTHGGRVRSAALDASGRIIVTADMEGVVRAGPATGEEPHLLLGQTLPATAVSVSPDRRWIASWSGEIIHLWPMPDVTQPPFHTLPYDELMAKLRAHTNLEVVEDKASPTGYKLEVGPFPGWETVPIW